MTIPWFLKNKTFSAPKRYLDKVAASYRPLLGIWLIDLALMHNWYCPQRGDRWPAIFADDDFCLLTGVQNPNELDWEDDEDGEAPPPPKCQGANACRKLLLKQRAVLQGETLSKNLPLFTNLRLLSKILGLNDADQALLSFAACLQLFPQFTRAISAQSQPASSQSLCQTLARLTGLPVKGFAAAIADEGVLIATNLVKLSRGNADLENMLDLMEGFGTVLAAKHACAEDLVRRFLRKASVPTLSLDNFSHLASDSRALRSYLGNAIAGNAVGVNILLHGKPGVGKTEYVQALAAELGVDLYEISFADEDGSPIKGKARLRAYNLCQRFLSRSRNSLLLFDEVEDVFESNHGFLSQHFGAGESAERGGSAGKAWINRTMERNPVPAVWVSNSVDVIDPAYKRRFDYSVGFPLPPRPVRLSIARHHLGCFDPPDSLLERLSANEELTPAQLCLAAKVARIASPEDKVRALGLVELTLERSIILLGQRCSPGRNVVRTGYSLDHLNIDADIVGILEGLKRRPRGSFCFYGAAGTGKSELARHLADQIGKPFLLRRASDLLSKYVGESEQNIAAMFGEARQQDAVLVLDEADSFLADRRGAQRSWEVTQVNELLTQMEAFEGIFVCTTNLIEKLDPASLRRFAFKVRFDPLTSDQRWSMFSQELIRLGGEGVEAHRCEAQVRALNGLTPGDFNVAARQFELCDTPATPENLCDILRRECQAKGAILGRIGFDASGRTGGERYGLL
jgi:transitional endoplasmic reticulum ATPase